MVDGLLIADGSGNDSAEKLTEALDDIAIAESLPSAVLAAPLAFPATAQWHGGRASCEPGPHRRPEAGQVGNSCMTCASASRPC
jgi:hypothetical protein